ncbi:MAG: DNA recombination/repair protein RecA, partial [Candidatus Promineifilaceae bacterium]
MANVNGDGRTSSLEKTLDSLTKKYGEGTIMRLGEAQHMQVETIPTGSLSLDIAL